jgi:hypothetical protein
MVVSVHESVEAFNVKAAACVQESIRELEQSQNGDDTSGSTWVLHLSFCLPALSVNA